MSLILDGTNGLSDVDGTAGTPAIRGSDANTGVFFGTDIVGVSTGGTERVRVDASGNVGIGTSSPAANLQIGKGAEAELASTAPFAWVSARASTLSGIAGAPQELLRLSWEEGGQNLAVGEGTAINFSARLVDDAAGVFRTVAQVATKKEVAEDNATSALTFSTSSDGSTANLTERARIDSSGNLLVGTTSAPTGSTGGSGFVVESVGRRTLKIATTTTGGAGLAEFINPNGVVGTISVSGSTTSYVTSSDYRLKHDIQPMTGALAKVAALKPVTYKWNADDSADEGFIAHELAEVCPSAVTGEKDAVDAEGNPQYQGIDTSFLTATLAAALQELHQIVKDQAAEVAELKAINDAQAQTIESLTARVVALENQIV